MEFDSLFLGSSDAAQRVRKQILRAARADSTVLILGESGVGKELVGREIHMRSARRAGPFVPVNCAAIPDALIESELFGHEAGAFTDARAPHRGAFELADRGTLLLDEVGDLSPSAQPKILRALESGTVIRLGGETTRTVNLRILAATNQDLLQRCREGRFREDLYYRLRILEIRIPPLRERREDIPELVERYARQVSESLGRPFRGIDPAALRTLTDYPWPGNVRELRAAVERALAMSSGMILDAGCFVLDPAPKETGLDALLDEDWETARARFEAAYLQTALERAGGNVRRAADATGLATRTFYKVLERLGIKPRPGPR